MWPSPSIDFKVLIVLEPDLKKPTHLYTGDDFRRYAALLQWPVGRVRRACHYKLFRRSTYLHLLAQYGKDAETRSGASVELDARAAAKLAKSTVKPPQIRKIHREQPPTNRVAVNLSRYRFV
jgi:hypothetical protein